MKRLLLLSLFTIVFMFLNAQILVTPTQINTINSSQSAADGDIYKDTENNVFYIGTSSGLLKIIGEVTKVNATLTGDGTVGNPLGIAPMGATYGQSLVWNGTSWTPGSGSGSTTVSNSVNGFQITTTVNGVTGNPVSLPFADVGVAGLIALSCDLTGTVWCPRVADNAITSAKIQNSTIQNEDLSSSSVSSDNIIDGTIITQDIANSQITFAKMQNISGLRLLGNYSSSVGSISEISLGTGLSFSGNVLNTTGAGTVTSVTGTSPITVTNGTTTPNIAITRNDIVAGSSSSSATNPLVLSGGVTNAVVGGSIATLTVNNTAPLWNANQLRGTNISTTSPTTGQVLRYDGTNWTPYTITSSGNKKLVISAEYAGAVIVPGSGADLHRGDLIGGNTGTTAPYYMNYYEWKGRYTGSQTYQVIVRITLPSDFTSWQSTNPFQFYNLANSGCSVTMVGYLSTSTTAFYTGAALTNTSWTATSLTTANLSSWATAGSTASFVFTFSCTNTNVSRIGDIILNYQ